MGNTALLKKQNTVIPINGDAEKEFVTIESTESDKSSEADHNYPKEASIIDSSLARAASLMNHPNARLIFTKYVKEGIWIQQLFQEHHMTQPIMRLNNKNSLRFKDYFLTAPVHRSSLNEDSLQSFSELVKRLKVKDSSESYDSTKLSSEIYDILSKSTLQYLILASALRLFALTPEFTQLIGCNWQVDNVNSFKFKYPEDLLPINNSGKTENLNDRKSIMSRSVTARTFRSAWRKTPSKDDPYSNIRNFYKVLIDELPKETIINCISKNDWVYNIQENIDFLPFTITYSTIEVHSHGTTYPIKYVNQSFAEYYGYDKNEMLNHDLMELLMPLKHAAHNQLMANRGSVKSSTKTLSISEKQGNSQSITHPTKLGIRSRHRNGWEFYNFVNILPFRDVQTGSVTNVLCLHYNMDSQESRIQDLKIIDDLVLLFSQIV